MNPFEYETQKNRVIFGTNSIQKIGSEIESLNLHKAAVITTSGRTKAAENIAKLLGDKCIGIIDKARQHVPIETVTESLQDIERMEADSLIAVGGGAAIGLAKAIALETHLPIIAIPTTYAGSEMTPIWGITANGQKKTGKNLRVKPQTVIYDPVLTVSLPTSITVVSAINSIAHCVEGLYSEHQNPITSLLAEEGIRAFRESLPKLLDEPNDLEIRSKVLYGAYLGGNVLGSVGMALHHKLCHILGGSFHLPHAETHAIVLPYVIWYNFSETPEAMGRLAKALETTPEKAAGTMFDLAQSLNIPTSLAQIGLKEENLHQAAEEAVKNPYFNPRPVDKKLILALLQHAYHGDRPEPGRFK